MGLGTGNWELGGRSRFVKAIEAHLIAHPWTTWTWKPQIIDSRQRAARRGYHVSYLNIYSYKPKKQEGPWSLKPEAQGPNGRQRKEKLDTDNPVVGGSGCCQKSNSDRAKYFFGFENGVFELLVHVHCSSTRHPQA
jgi:hypothetical protein